VQGAPVDIGGYYHPDDARTFAAMRPSKTLNTALERLSS
jgi:isocitrate dehydrogenase